MLDLQYYEQIGLGDILRKVQTNSRLDLEDGARLFQCSDVVAVGALAHRVRKRLHGDAAFYVLNQHVNYSNICVNGCRFCAFQRKAGEAGAFELTVEQVLDKVRERPPGSVKELHIVGGCHPDLPLEYFERVIRGVKSLRPELDVKAFTVVEIAHFARLAGISPKEVLVRLKDAGLEMLTGGGAEVFSPRVRQLLCPEKLDGEGWLGIARQAHQLGIKSNATMLYGHLETEEERLRHLIALRNLQDETGGFNCFIPLPFQPANNQVYQSQGTTGVEDLKTIAVSRLMLDNIPHIKAYWVMLTVKLAQVALNFGADDLDGTVIEEKIGHMAGAESQQALLRTELERIIQDAGFRPVERDCLFNRTVPAPATDSTGEE